MKHLKVLLIASLLVLAAVGIASAQDPAYQTPFITSVTYQNVSSADASLTFYFYQEGSSTPIEVPRTIPAGAGDSLYIGGLTEIPDNFSGSAVVSADQPIVATMVQIPQSDTVKNRPLSNGFSSASTQSTIATVLKNKFNQTTKFSVQNTDSNAADISVTFYNADDPSATPIVATRTNVPAGSAVSFDMGSIPEITASSFNGSAIVTANRAGTSTPVNIVASALELSTNSTGASAFEGVVSGAQSVYMPSALCNAFGGQETFYAVTNTSQSQGTNVTVTYSNGTSESANLGAGKKASFRGCGVDGDLNPAGFSGSAEITSDTTDIVVIGKVAGMGISSAFLGEPQGSDTLALPYVRWTSQENFNNGAQRAFIAIQNVSGSDVSNVQVKYLNKEGTVVGTHTISSIPAKEKRNSTAPQAASDPSNPPIELAEFGYPAANPGGGYGGSVLIEGPSGSQLVAVVRVASGVGGGSLVGEDYNGMAVE